MHSRRTFLKGLGLSAAAALARRAQAATNVTESLKPSTGVIPKRPYGRDKIPLSIIGFGGIVVKNTAQDQANRLVAEVVERGVNYFDVGPSYGDAEVKLGEALKPYRKNVFLSCKTTQRMRAEGQAEMEKSFEQLHTDYFDLYQLHGIADVKKDVDVAFGPGGVMEAIIEARRAGRIRHVGFSAHSVESALAALDRYEFDSVLFPVNFACWLKYGFGPQVVARAQAKGATVLALKAMAKQKLPAGAKRLASYRKCWYEPLTERADIAAALRFTLAQGVTAAIPPGEESLFRLALDVAGELGPLTDTDRTRLAAMAATLDPVFGAQA